MLSPKPSSFLIMGVLNVTPDSFSDGGAYPNAEAAMDAGLRMFELGADIVDVGGESTRPGSRPISLDEELDRTLPVVRALVSRGVAVSIDTSKPEVARRAVDAGAVMVNDVTGFRSGEMISVVASSSVCACAMHMRGEPRTMQTEPHYEDVVGEVCEFLFGRADALLAAGVESHRLWIDPGIGFGKTLTHNLQLLRSLSVLAGRGDQVMVGVSRKSFLGTLSGETRPAERVAGSIAAGLFAVTQGAKALRVHDVAQTVQARAVWSQLSL